MHNSKTKFKGNDSDSFVTEFDDLEDIKNVSINDSEFTRYKIEDPEVAGKRVAKKYASVFSNFLSKLV